MPRYIVKLMDGDRAYYLFWSTVVDAPVSNGCSLAEFEAEYRTEFGESGFGPGDSGYTARMERVETKGTSSQLDDDITELLSVNRAGPGESPLTYEEIVRFYCRGEVPDDSHPCWQQRRDEEHRRMEANEEYAAADVCAMFPYTDTAT